MAENYFNPYGRHDGWSMPLDEMFTGNSYPGWIGGRGHHSFERRDEEETKKVTVVLEVPLCCDKSERKVRDLLEDMEGAEKVTCDQWTKKVTVKGHVRPDFVLKRVQRIKKDSKFWPKNKTN